MKKVIDNILTFIIALVIIFLFITLGTFIMKLAIDFWIDFLG